MSTQIRARLETGERAKRVRRMCEQEAPEPRGETHLETGRPAHRRG